MERYIQIIKDWFLNLTGAQKRILVLSGTIGFSLILTIVVLSTMQVSGKDKIPREPERLSIVSPIPAEEVFLPDEPDFIPGVILEREKRSIWTEQNVLEYWKDPLESNDAQWREKLENEIDKYLEYIP